MENCWQPSPHSSQDYYPHYNLFQSSIFYDTDNFRVPCLLEDCVPSESSENEEKSAEPPDKPPGAPPEAPVKAKRVIAKQELYRDPDQFGRDDGQSNTNSSIDPTQPWGYDWTKQSWVKEGAPVTDTKEDRRTPEHQPAAPRVNNSKAESMMHKMGWQGGALGRTGDGITEPLTPKAVHAFRPSPGQGPQRKKPAAPAGNTAARKNQNLKDAFRTNILLHVLEFVQDDTESELLFDPSLRPHERRHVTNIVHTVVNQEALHSLGSTAQYELARDIHKHNKYVLECAQDNNQLGIYKEAPEDVYLVTPEDFLPKDDTDDDKNDTDVVNDKNVTNDVDTKVNGELEDDENPFLKSIKKSIKKDDEPKLTNKFETDCVIAKESDPKVEGGKGESPPAKMMEFFLEFAETETYKEMRFLGTFSDPQSSAINDLLNAISTWPPECRDRTLARALTAGPFRVRDGANGTPEIHKVTASTGRDLGKT